MEAVRLSVWGGSEEVCQETMAVNGLREACVSSCRRSWELGVELVERGWRLSWYEGKIVAAKSGKRVLVISTRQSRIRQPSFPCLKCGS